MIRIPALIIGGDIGSVSADFARTGKTGRAAFCLFVVMLYAACAGCRSPGAHISRRALLRGVERALSERDAISYVTLVRQDDATLTAYCDHRRDGSAHMKVFRDDRLIYELVTRFDPTGPSMRLTERNHLNGKSIDYAVPVEEYCSESYDPQWLHTSGWGCAVGSDWQSWLGPRSYFRPYLAGKIRNGRLSTVARDDRELVRVVEPHKGFRHEYYFDPQDYLLREWRTVDASDPRLTRDRIYVYCDGMSTADCLAALDSNALRLAKSEGEVP